MCDLPYSNVWLDSPTYGSLGSFTCVTWLIHVRATCIIHMWYDLFYMCAKFHINPCDLTQNMCHDLYSCLFDAFIRTTWLLIHVCAVCDMTTHSRVCHHWITGLAFICWSIHRALSLHTHTRTYTHTHKHTHTHTHTYTNTHMLVLSLSHSHTHTQTLTHIYRAGSNL